MTRFLPFQDAIVQCFLKVSLFNTFVYDIFLHYRSFDGKSSEYVRGRIEKTEEVCVGHEDDGSTSGQLSFGGSCMKDEDQDPALVQIIGRISKHAQQFRYYRIMFVVVLLVLIIKETVVIFLRHLPEDSPYRLLDCFILGRTTFSGTYSQVSHRIDLLLTGSQLFWIAYLLIAEPSIRLGCLEFIFHNGDQVRAIELEALDSSSQAGTTTIRRSASISGDLIIRQATKALDRTQPKTVRFPLYQYREPLLKSASQSSRVTSQLDSIGFRRNRSFDCWSKLLLTTSKFLAICIYAAFILWYPLVYSFTTVLLTKQGFELNYSTCANYLRSNREDANRFANILDASERRPAKPLGLFLDSTDIIALHEPYHQIRLVIDFLQSFFIINGTAISIVTNTYYLIIIAVDVENYLSPLEEQLDRLVHDLRRNRGAHRQTIRLYGDLSLSDRQVFPDTSSRFTRPQTSDNRCNRLLLSKRISDLQAQSMDFWSIIAHYNTYVQSFVCLVIFDWIVYSVLVSDYLLAPGGVVYYDVIACQALATAYFIGVIGQFATITQRIRRMYPKMATAMALDDDCTGTKTRWPTMLSYFHPKPLCSFTIAGFTISWNFCLQVSNAIAD